MDKTVRLLWQIDSHLRYSSMDLAYLFQDLRSEALKAISWPSRCGIIVRPASGDAQTVNCAETRRERQQTVEVCKVGGGGTCGGGASLYLVC